MKKMKKMIVTTILAAVFAGAVGFGLIPSMDQKAACADCDTDNLPSIKNIFTKFAEECAKAATDGKEQPRKCFVPNTYAKLVTVMKIFAKDNRFGPGDRILFVGETQNGNLIAGADRAFQTGAPSDKDSVTVEVNKIDGENGAIVRICSVDDDLKVTHLKSMNFVEGAKNGAQTVTVTGVQGKVLRVSISSFGSPIRKFKYALKTN